MRKPTVMPIVLASLCVAWFFYVTYTYGSTEDTNVLIRAGALSAQGLNLTEWWRLVTAMFIHIGTMHLLSNMLLLITFGVFIERAIGSIKFTILYLISGIGGNIVSAILEPNVVAAGASTALFGLMGFITMQIFNKRNNSLRHLGLGYFSLVALNVFYTFSHPEISITGHIGGFITGAIIGIFQLIEDK